MFYIPILQSRTYTPQLDNSDERYGTALNTQNSKHQAETKCFQIHYGKNLNLAFSSALVSTCHDFLLNFLALHIFYRLKKYK